jgi:hypothetical protein
MSVQTYRCSWDWKIGVGTGQAGQTQEELDGNLPRTQRQNKQVCGVGNLEITHSSLETAEARELHVNHAQIECTRAQSRLGRKRGECSVPVMSIGWHRCTSMNGTIAQRHNQLPSNQEIKSLWKPLDKQLPGLSLSVYGSFSLSA